MWIVLTILLVLFLLSRADARNRSQLPTRSWNVWFGPKPREREGRTRYTLRRALAAALALVVFAVPLFVISAPPDEGTSFRGDELPLDMVVFMVCAPLSAMAFISLFALLFSSLMSAIFRSDHVFDADAGEFLRR